MDDEDKSLSLRARVHRAVALVRSGHTRRALNIIDRQPLPLLTPQRIRNLLALHPQPSQPIRQPNNINSIAPLLKVDVNTVRRLIKQCNNGAAAGPSNLTMSHLYSISLDPDCMEGLVAIIQDIVNAAIDPAAIAIITSAISIAISKPGTDPHAIRPLAVPESLYKLAALVCLDAIKPIIPSLFPSIQLGCGISGGIEIALHRTQLALETGGGDTVVLRTDFKNAFNSRRRHLIAHYLYKQSSTSPIWRFFSLAYGQPHGSHMGIYERGELIYSFINSEGVKQGCPLAALLYALSVQQLYEDCISLTPDVQAYAIQDDLTLIGPAPSITIALNRLIHLCKSNDDGPQLNLHKCEALWAHTTNHPSFPAFESAMIQHNITIRYDTISMLGSTIGLGMHRAQHVNNLFTTHQTLFDAILHPDMPSQIGLLLLRQSALPRLSYHLRITPPIIIRHAAERYDERLLLTAARKLNLPLPFDRHPSTLLILRTPLSLDGIGLRPHTRTSPAAYWSSFASFARCIRGAHHIDSIAEFINHTDTHKHLLDTFNVLRNSGIDPFIKKNRQSFPTQFNDFWSFYSSSSKLTPHLQRHISRQLDSFAFIKAPALAPLEALSNFQHQLNQNDLNDDDKDSPSNNILSTITSWLTTVPRTPYTSIPTSIFNAALRHHYDLPPSDYQPPICKLCGRLFDYPSHYHSCIEQRKGTINERHDIIKMTVAHFNEQAGIKTIIEPRLPNERGQRTRPDFSFYSHTHGRIYSDVSICSAYAPSNIKNELPH